MGRATAPHKRKESNMNISMNTLKDDIDRAFRVLGAERGFSQNVTDIKAWTRDGFLTEEEAHELRQYNRAQYSKLPLDA